MNPSKRSLSETEVGLACAVACALLWGVLPIYWKSLHPIPPVLIMFYRLVLACILVFVASLRVYGWKGLLAPVRVKGAAFRFLVAGIVISTNWGLYIYMVNAGWIIQTSIGYYIEPLVVCVFGVVFFREKMERHILIAFLLACVGVGVMLFSFGQLPVAALSLAVTFAVYAGVKKKLKAPALLALFYETIFLVPIVVPVILYLEFTGQGAFSVGDPGKTALLFLSGLFTAVPLSLFAMAANRISLVALGITEYLSPSMALVLGIFLYREPFDVYQFAGFVIIWIGLAVFTIGGIRSARAVPVVGVDPAAIREPDDEN